MLHRIAVGLVLSLVTWLGISPPASAKDVCIEYGTTSFRFKGVKSLKKPGSISPPTGSSRTGATTFR
jgi:hypothetical protein